MNRNKLKILVLSDLKQNSKDTLKYAINLAKEFNGALELLCVKEPNETITTENPLSAMRNLSSTYIKTEQKLNKQIENITKEDFFPVKKIIEFGNVKNEIENRIEHSNPDFIIIGKKQKRLLNYSTDNITVFLLKKYNSKVCISNKTSFSDIYEVLNQKYKKAQTA